MADTPQLKVGWDCPICHWVGQLTLTTTPWRSHGDNVVFALDPEDNGNQYVKDHIKIHLAEIKKSWRSIESTLGALGYSMEVQIDKRIDPDEDPVVPEPSEDNFLSDGGPTGGDYPW